MHAFQMNFLDEDNSKVAILTRENDDLRESVAKLRKSFFSRLTNLEKELITLKAENERTRAMLISQKVG
jgi:hypothetical protein